MNFSKMQNNYLLYFIFLYALKFDVFCLWGVCTDAGSMPRAFSVLGKYAESIVGVLS